MRIDRRDFLRRSAWCGGSSILLPSFLSAQSAESGADRPNVLFVLTDQQHWDSMGIYGNARVATPNLDRLGREGLVFDRAYVTQPVCSPCRSSILTGLWPHSTGVMENCEPSGPAPPLPLDAAIFPLLLRRAGYASGYIGKWHLSEVETWAKRFDLWEGFQTGGGHWIGDRYKTDVQTEQGIAFVREHRRRPFCLFMAYYPPHTPRTAPESYVQPYRDAGFEEPGYYGMVGKIDDNVGQLLGALDEAGVRDRTLVVYTSDHGEAFGRYWNRHEKRVCYDAGARVPLIMAHPRRIPGGRRSDALVSSADLGPTILEFCGLEFPREVQGRSFAAVCEGRRDTARDFLVIENYPVKPDHGYVERCIVAGAWKLILDSRRPPELYDLDRDPREERNLFAEPRGREVLPGLIGRLDRWGRETNDPVAVELAASVPLETMKGPA